MSARHDKLTVWFWAQCNFEPKIVIEEIPPMVLVDIANNQLDEAREAVNSQNCGMEQSG